MSDKSGSGRLGVIISSNILPNILYEQVFHFVSEKPSTAGGVRVCLNTSVPNHSTTWTTYAPTVHQVLQ